MGLWDCAAPVWRTALGPCNRRSREARRHPASPPAHCSGTGAIWRPRSALCWTSTSSPTRTDAALASSRPSSDRPTFRRCALDPPPPPAPAAAQKRGPLLPSALMPRGGCGGDRGGCGGDGTQGTRTASGGPSPPGPVCPPPPPPKCMLEGTRADVDRGRQGSRTLPAI